jgi:hypothetical protein
VAEDHSGIAALLDRTFGPQPRQLRERLWAWRHEANAISACDMPSFLVGDLGGEIVGVQGLLPLRFRAGSETILSACSCDLAAAPSARGAGLQLKHMAMSATLSALPLTTSANAAANRLTRALGGAELEPARVKYIKPLRVGELLAARARRRAPRRGAALQGAAGVVDSGVNAARMLYDRFGPRALGSQVRIEEIAHFDARFDALWERISSRCPVMIVRDAAYLEWRYARYPFTEIESFALTSGEELRGFAVLQLAGDEDGLTAASLLELFGEDAALEPLLTEAIRRAVRGKASYLAAKTSSAEHDRLLKSKGFLARASEHSPYTYKVNRPDLATLLGEASNWYISLGDGDISFAFGPARR